jgi:PAS domain S-box-containing protein
MKLRPPSSFTAPLDRPAWQVYGFAAVMLIGALAFRWSLEPLVRGGVPLAAMYVAVAFSVWYGGWKPAALIAVVGYFGGLFLFLPPRFTFKLWADIGIIRTFLYALSCSIIIYLCESIRRARQRHAASEKKLVSMLENMREAFCSVDADWRISFANRGAEEFLQSKRAALIGRSLWDVLPASVNTPAEAELRRAMREESSVNFETNTFVPGSWHAVTATRVDGELSIFFQDITASRAHVDQLERLVDDRTAALQRIVSDLEAFSYTLVHDMRAPLRAISGFAEILSMDHAQNLNADGKRHLGRIEHSAARMDQLIVDILSYSQLSRNPPELRPVNLDATVRDILRSHREFQPDRADIDIVAPLPVVNGNDALLTQCFSNLLHNATKFVAPMVKPRIRIGARVDGETARIEITDNGIGIAPEAVGRIFEPFRREHANYDGTGIGLAIVQRVVDQLGGRVGVDSEPGKGSCFWVELRTRCRPAVTSPEAVGHQFV